MAAFSTSTSFTGMEAVGLKNRTGLLGFSDQFSAQKLETKGTLKAISDQSCSERWRKKSCLKFSVHAQASAAMNRSGTPRWWDKHLVPNMAEIYSAQELIDAISMAGDKLLVVDFFSPGCGGCRALHPKICKIAESNPEVQFLTVNYEKLKPLCHSLHIHVLPFFRFYRGAEGRVSSFSCTIATINKFKNALAKHGSDRCTLGPTKGLEESELLSLVASRELPHDFLPNPASRVRYDFEFDMPCANLTREQLEASAV